MFKLKMTKIQTIYMILLCYTLLLSSSLAAKKAKDTCPEDKVYKGPGSAKYPFGDEEMSENVLDEAGVARCITQDGAIDYQSTCFAPAKQLETQEIYISCVNDTFKAEMDKIFFKLATQCTKCTLKKTGDNLAVVVECTDCHNQLPPPSKKKSKDQGTNMLLLTYFLEIGNYTGNVEL